MKRLLAFMLIFAFILSLCGCGNEKSVVTKTITASNGDKIDLEISGGNNPLVLVKVNSKEIYSYNNYQKHKDEYNFENDFTDEVIAEYSDDEILWAYRFDWGVIYSTKYTTTTTDSEATISYACSKHEYEKCLYKNLGHNTISEVWNLVDFDVIEETGTKIFWDPYVATQMIFEYFYKTENYTLKQIDDLAKAGYGFDDYYTMHDKEFSSGAGLNKYRRIYEVSVDGKPFALIYADSTCNYFLLQELHWETAYPIVCKSFDETGVVYEMAKLGSDKLTTFS